MKKRTLMALGVACALAFTGCSASSGSSSAGDSKAGSSVQADSSADGSYVPVEDTDPTAQASQDIFAMDTYMTVTAYGSNGQEAVNEAVSEIEMIDETLSTGNEDSEIAKVNANGGGTLSEMPSYLVERSLELYDMTDGVFDIAIYPVMKAWGFTDQNYKVPEESELKKLLKLTDASDIEFDEVSGEIEFKKEGMMIDLGGIAKGYTSGRIMDIYRSCGVTSGLVSLGGNVQVYGTKPDGSNWKVAIQNPDGSSNYLGVLQTADKAVITSGGYERYFEEDGKTYHHIIDPSTGYPAESGIVSSTIVSADGTLADGLSTSLFIMGKDKAVSFWKEHSDEFDFILLDENDTLWVTEGIADSFTSDFDVEVVSK